MQASLSHKACEVHKISKNKMHAQLITFLLFNSEYNQSKCVNHIRFLYLGLKLNKYILILTGFGAEMKGNAVGLLVNMTAPLPWLQLDSLGGGGCIKQKKQTFQTWTQFNPCWHSRILQTQK